MDGEGKEFIRLVKRYEEIEETLRLLFKCYYIY